MRTIPKLGIIFIVALILCVGVSVGFMFQQKNSTTENMTINMTNNTTVINNTTGTNNTSMSDDSNNTVEKYTTKQVTTTKKQQSTEKEDNPVFDNQEDYDAYTQKEEKRLGVTHEEYISTHVGGAG